MLHHPTLDKLNALKFTGMAKGLAEQMALPEIELRLAMSWRVREISYYQMVIEETHCAYGLSNRDRASLRVFASEEIHRLNLASDKEIVGLYLLHLFLVSEAEQMTQSIEEPAD